MEDQISKPCVSALGVAKGGAKEAQESVGEQPGRPHMGSFFPALASTQGLNGKCRIPGSVSESFEAGFEFLVSM